MFVNSIRGSRHLQETKVGPHPTKHRTMALPETPSAKMPLMDASRLDMVKGINMSAPNSNCSIFLMFPEVLKISNSGIPIAETLRELGR